MQQHDVLFNNIIFFYYIMEIQHLAIERLDFLQKILYLYIVVSVFLEQTDNYNIISKMINFLFI